MKKFKILGKEISFKDRDCSYYDIVTNKKDKDAIQKIYNVQEPIFQKELDDYRNNHKTDDYECFFGNIERIGDENLNPGLEYLLTILYEQYHIYDVTIQDLVEEYGGYKDWHVSFSSIDKAFEEIRLSEKQLKNDKEVNWKSNGRWIGGGIGLGGALKGAFTARLMNATSDVIHGTVNVLGNTYVNYKVCSTGAQARKAVYNSAKDMQMTLCSLRRASEHRRDFWKAV